MIDVKTSMLYWHPITSKLDIPQPQTTIIKFDKYEKETYMMGEGDGLVTDRLSILVQETIDEKYDLPVFLRTDYASAKHGWKKTCYLDNIADLERHIFELTSFSLLADMFGIPCNAIVVREYIPMKNLFTAFYGEMPINPEIRFFIKNGEILCYHWYWVEDAIESGTHEDKLPKDWRNILNETKKETFIGEISLLKTYSRMIAKAFPNDFLSVDFCKGQNDKWYLIDMAEGGRSWHPENCEHYVKRSPI